MTNGEKSDLIRSEKAQFDIDAKTLYSDGEVDIIMGVPADQPPTGRLLRIHGSGMHFASDTGKATTDRAVTFSFDRGNGSAVGAEYDPNTRELQLHSKVVLDWRGKTPEAKPMHVESDQAIYTERDSKVVLFPVSKFTRDTLHMEGGRSDVQLDKGAIRFAKIADGSRRPRRSGPQGGVCRGRIEPELRRRHGDSHHRRSRPRAVDLDFRHRANHREFRPPGHGFRDYRQREHAQDRRRDGKSVVQATPVPRPGELSPATRAFCAAT